jgi:hypothetical protein
MSTLISRHHLQASFTSSATAKSPPVRRSSVQARLPPHRCRHSSFFDPATGPLRAGLQTPAALLSPSYGSADQTTEHRWYQTIEALSDRLGLAIVSAYAEGDEPALASAVVSQYSGVFPRDPRGASYC